MCDTRRSSHALELYVERPYVQAPSKIAAYPKRLNLRQFLGAGTHFARYKKQERSYHTTRMRAHDEIDPRSFLSLHKKH